jgi:hypothetical protein
MAPAETGDVEHDDIPKSEDKAGSLRAASPEVLSTTGSVQSDLHETGEDSSPPSQATCETDCIQAKDVEHDDNPQSEDTASSERAESRKSPTETRSVQFDLRKTGEDSSPPRQATCEAELDDDGSRSPPTYEQGRHQSPSSLSSTSKISWIDSTGEGALTHEPYRETIEKIEGMR